MEGRGAGRPAPLFIEMSLLDEMKENNELREELRAVRRELRRVKFQSMREPLARLWNAVVHRLHIAALNVEKHNIITEALNIQRKKKSL